MLLWCRMCKLQIRYHFFNLCDNSHESLYVGGGGSGMVLPNSNSWCHVLFHVLSHMYTNTICILDIHQIRCTNITKMEKKNIRQNNPELHVAQQQVWHVQMHRAIRHVRFTSKWWTWLDQLCVTVCLVLVPRCVQALHCLQSDFCVLSEIYFLPK